MTADDLGNALPLRLGFTLLWTGWDPGAPTPTGLSLDVPVVEGVTQVDPRGVRLRHTAWRHEAFRLAYEAVAHRSVLTVRRTQDAPRGFDGKRNARTAGPFGRQAAIETRLDL